MADPTSLTEFATRAVDDLKAAQQAANQEVTASRDALVDADGDLRTAADNLAKANAALAEIRRQLAAIGMPADGEPLLTALKNAIVDQRSKTAALTAADLAQAAAKARLDRAQAALSASVAALATAEAAKKAVTDAQKRRDGAKTAINAAPITDLDQAATDALNGTDYGKAQTRITGALPASLRTQTIARAGQALDAVKRAEVRQAAAQAALDAFVEETGLGTDTLPRLQRADAQAEAALLGWVDSAPRQLSASKATLHRLAGLNTPAVSLNQKTSIEADGPNRDAAATEEGKWDAAAAKVADALNALEIERIKALVADPAVDLATAEADATTDLGTAKQAWDDAKADFATEDGVFTPAMRTTMSEWRATVPDSLWLEAETFFAADDALQRLKTATATSLVNALTTAESNLLAALIADAKRRARAGVAAAELASTTAVAVAARARAEALRAAAVRTQPTLDVFDV